MMKNEGARIIVRGVVQGVGFRPFVFRLASELHVSGWVLNCAEGVEIELEGPHPVLCEFVDKLRAEKPAAAIIEDIETSFCDACGYHGFEIRRSDQTGNRSVLISPDLATCQDCLRDIFDSTNRRFLYPLTNCTNCGPRFSIIEELPYDRINTSMKRFTMCAECEREYHDPTNRRFHAQPNACPVCGPRLELWAPAGRVLATCEQALAQAVSIIRAGDILALKGIGGFQLIVDATNEVAVQRLRKRKQREEKPFAVMCPTIDVVRTHCRVSALGEHQLRTPAAPIVLLEKAAADTGPSSLAPSVAPRNPCIGVMLPYSPLHHLLLRELGSPVVATSGNISDEPICTDESEALERLHGVADFFLVHNRPIVRHVDDSVVRVICGRELVLRRARGFAPIPLMIRRPMPNVLAVGAHLKNTVALSVGRNVFVSQHLGDLETKQAWLAFGKTVADLPHLYNVNPTLVAHDLHPDYLSTHYAIEQPVSRCPVQHHLAHVAACMADNDLEPPTLGVAWDGTGLGTDGTIWGGEFFIVDGNNNTRAAHLLPFRLPGGEAAIKQPTRSMFGALHRLYQNSGDRQWIDKYVMSRLFQHFAKSELALMERLIETGTNAPLTSSAGRLFDAVAALLGLRQHVSFEGQAAMELEFAIEPGVDTSYLFSFEHSESAVLDWRPMVQQIIDDIAKGQVVGVIAAKFHNTMAEMIVAVAQKAGMEKVVLSGGCFQNKYLTERTIARLRQEGFQPFWHHRIPPNDGGIAVGQIVVAAWAQASTTSEDTTRPSQENDFLSLADANP